MTVMKVVSKMKESPAQSKDKKVVSSIEKDKQMKDDSGGDSGDERKDGRNKKG